MKICLCGSTRFMDQFHDANVYLSLQGIVVYSVATSTKGDFKPTEDQKIALDAVHLQKIHESDAIMVVGQQEDGSVYIGDSTRREMMYAAVFDKNIYFWDPSRQRADVSVKEFEEALKSAKTTTAEREEQRRRAEEKRKQMMESIGIGAPGNLEHDGTPDCPACKALEEGTSTDVAHTH